MRTLVGSVAPRVTVATLASLAALAALASAACTSRYALPRATSDLAGGTEVTVEVSGAGSLEATAVHTSSGLAYRAADGRYLDPLTITRVTHTSRGRGAIQGLAIGAGLGAVIGATAGYADGDDECEGFCLFLMSASDKAVLGGALLGSLGGLVGLVAGAAIGASDVYESSETIRVTPTAPPGSQVGMTVTF